MFILGGKNCHKTTSPLQIWVEKQSRPRRPYGDRMATSRMSDNTAPLSCWVHQYHPSSGQLLDGDLPLVLQQADISSLINGPSRGVYLIDFRGWPLPTSKCMAPAVFGKNDFRSGTTTSGAKRRQWDGYDSSAHHTILLLYPEQAPPSVGKADVLALALATPNQPFVVTINHPKAKVVFARRILVFSCLSISAYFALEDQRYWLAKSLFEEIDLEFRHVSSMCDLVQRRGRRRRSKNGGGQRLNISLLFAEAAAQQIGRRRRLVGTGPERRT